MTFIFFALLSNLQSKNFSIYHGYAKSTPKYTGCIVLLYVNRFILKIVKIHAINTTKIISYFLLDYRYLLKLYQIFY